MNASRTADERLSTNGSAKRYRYVHIVTQKGVGFIENIVALFRDDASHTDINEHLFVTPIQQLYEDIHTLCNAVLTREDEYHTILYWAKYADVLFVHGLHTSMFRLAALPNRVCRKIVLRTWGHDIVIPERSGSGAIKYIAKRILFGLYARKVRKFKAIGVANATDTIKVRKAFGNGVPVVEMPYGNPPEIAQRNIDALDSIMKSGLRGNKLRIMIGHSGYEIDRQIPLIDVISKYRDEDIVVSVPLVYGNREYIEKVKAHAIGVFGDKCEIITEKMEYLDYARYINSVDIAVMDMYNSAAIGNISLLLYFDKKLFLNKDGDIAAAFNEYGLHYETTDNLPSMDFATFTSPLRNSLDSRKRWGPMYYDAGFCADCWNRIFKFLLTDETEGTSCGQ